MTRPLRGAGTRVIASMLGGVGGIRLLALASGRLALRSGRLRARTAPVFPILAYHRVNDEADPFFPAVPTAVFEAHVAYLARRYRILTVEEAVTRLQGGTLPRDAIAITFDDGYRDNLTHAAPILARHRAPATVFLATGLVGTGEAAWFDRLALAFKTTRTEAVPAAWAPEVSLRDRRARLDALERTLTHLKTLPDDDMRREVDRLLRVLCVTETGAFKNLMLDWDDVHALTGLGFSIGAHTVSHPILSRVDDRRARAEIVTSRAMIQSACGEAPLAFAYPNGTAHDYGERDVRLVRDAGFRCAVTSRFGLNDARTSSWELNRGGPWEPHVPSFALKLAWYRLTHR